MANLTSPLMRERVRPQLVDRSIPITLDTLVRLGGSDLIELLLVKRYWPESGLGMSIVFPDPVRDVEQKGVGLGQFCGCRRWSEVWAPPDLEGRVLFRFLPFV